MDNPTESPDPSPGSALARLRWSRLTPAERVKALAPVTLAATRARKLLARKRKAKRRKQSKI